MYLPMLDLAIPRTVGCRFALGAYHNLVFGASIFAIGVAAYFTILISTRLLDGVYERFLIEERMRRDSV